MTLFQLFILALIQGVTEFLPISSSAHLILAPYVFGTEDQGALIDVMAHVGTLAAVLIYFRGDVAGVLAGLPDLVRGRTGGKRRTGPRAFSRPGRTGRAPGALRDNTLRGPGW